VSEKTIRNDAHYLGAVEGIESLGVPRSSLVGKSDAPRQSAIGLAGLLASSDPDQQARGDRMVGLMRDGASLRDVFVKSKKATDRVVGSHETADAAVDAAVDLAGEADGKRKRASHPRQATVSAQATDSASASVPNAVEESSTDLDDADRVAVVPFGTTEVVANSPDRNVQGPAAPRLPLFDTEEPAIAEDSPPIGRKAGTTVRTKASGDMIPRTTDPVIIAATLFEWLGSTKTTALVGLLQDLVRIDAKRMVPIPGQMTFV